MLFKTKEPEILRASDFFEWGTFKCHECANKTFKCVLTKPVPKCKRQSCLWKKINHISSVSEMQNYNFEITFRTLC